MRFGLAFLPPIAVAASVGLLGQVRLRAWRIVMLAGCLIAGAPFTVRGIAALLEVKQRETTVLQAVRTAVPTGSPVVTFGISAMLEQYTDYAVHDLYLTSPRELDAVRCGTAPAFAVVDERTLDAQWKGLPPARHFGHLRDAGVSPVTHAGKWTLFTISSAGCPSRR
jgi:hypothetical protein